MIKDASDRLPSDKSVPSDLVGLGWDSCWGWYATCCSWEGDTSGTDPRGVTVGKGLLGWPVVHRPTGIPSRIQVTENEDEVEEVP